jgi:5S rRNA maturation endonuclease (ribonuclease M5)
MSYKVFISYSTKDLSIVEDIKRVLTKPEVEVFIAEDAISPGNRLNDTIVDEIKNCDMFVLLWTRNSKSSEYVQQEIGIARGNNKTIFPIVLETGLQLPAFIKELKYLKAYGTTDEIAESLKRFQKNIFSRSEKQQLTNALVLLVLGVVLLWLLSQK